MKILTVNAGSSSLKFSLFEMPETEPLASRMRPNDLSDFVATIK